MTEHKRRDAALQIKAVDEEKRQFTGLASTWEKDLGGDVITKGAFAKTLKEWESNGKVLPLLDSHKYGSISAVLGKMIDARRRTRALRPRSSSGQDPQGEEAWDLVREGYVDGLSIGYEARAWEKPDDEEKSEGVHRKLTEINLVEVSLVQMPMNQGARIAAVKSALDAMQPGRDERRGPQDATGAGRQDRRTPTPAGLEVRAGAGGGRTRPRRRARSEAGPAGPRPDPRALGRFGRGSRRRARARPGSTPGATGAHQQDPEGRGIRR
jgi:HK97 family phage prohead protease